MRVDMFWLLWILAFYPEQTYTQVNLALNKPAFESSSYIASYPEMANDGNRIAQRYVGTCAHTTAELNPWWTVDLKGDYSIHSLRIYNRDESKCPPNPNCGDRLTGFRVHVSDGMNATVPETRFKHLCHKDDKKPPMAAIIDINCTSSIVGRYVTVSLNRTSIRALTLCEVEVYGFNISGEPDVQSTPTAEATTTHTDRVNLALNKPAFESTSYNASYPGMANDGNKIAQRDIGTCSHTMAELTPWWTVDLKGDYSIHSMRIYNRDESKCHLHSNCADRLAGFRVHVSDEINASVPSTRFKRLCHTGDENPPVPVIIDFNCTSPLVGRYVTISLNLTSVRALTLCEVEVYGFNVSVDSSVLSTTSTGAAIINTDQYMEEVFTTPFPNISVDTKIESGSTSQFNTDNPGTSKYNDQSATSSSVPLITDTSASTPLPISSPRDAFRNTQAEFDTTSQIPIDNASIGKYMEQSTTTSSRVQVTDQSVSPTVPTTSVRRTPLGTQIGFGTTSPLNAESVTINTAGHGFTASNDVTSDTTIFPDTDWVQISNQSRPEMTTQDDASLLVLQMTSTPVLSNPTTVETEEFRSSQKPCCCSFAGKPSITRQQSNTLMSSVLQELDIDKKNVTKERRKYISVPDERKSSAAISISFMAVTLALCGILLCDVNKVWHDVKGYCLR